MKYLILSIIGIFLFGGIALAQSRIDKGGVQLNAGLGFSGWGIPVYVGMDFGVHQDVTIGGELSYRNYNQKLYGNKYSHQVIGLLVNGNYHFNTLLEIPDPWDVYAGLNIGYYSWSSAGNYPGNSSAGVGLGLQVGGRYYFTDKIGINLVLGGGNNFSGGKIGVTIKF